MCVISVALSCVIVTSFVYKVKNNNRKMLLCGTQLVSDGKKDLKLSVLAHSSLNKDINTRDAMSKAAARYLGKQLKYSSQSIHFLAKLL